MQLYPLLEASNKDIVDRILHDDGSLIAQSPLYSEVRKVLLAESTTVPLPTVIALSALFVWLVFTDTMKDLVTCGSFMFWILVFSIVPLVAAMMAVARRQLIHKDVIKQAVRFISTASCSTSPLLSRPPSGSLHCYVQLTTVAAWPVVPVEQSCCGCWVRFRCLGAGTILQTAQSLVLLQDATHCSILSETE